MYLPFGFYTLLRFCTITIVSSLLLTLKTFGQGCPENIGFEHGDFQNWVCETGIISGDGEISLTETSPVSGRHDIVESTSLLTNDFYGNFPVNAPNGSGFSVKLGETGSGTKADRISYTFVVPQNQADYSIIYNYAVVFFNPPNNHEDFEQPKFTAKIFDVSAGEYVQCGSFNFVSSSGLPGFQQSIKNSSVYYKPWAPITLNLSGYAGKKIRLEFTVNGCSKQPNGSHFGYAYIDVNQNCDSPIQGNIICDPSSIRLSAPEGFQGYVWYKASDLTNPIGSGNNLTVSPSPPAGSRYAVRITPYLGFGCETILYTTVSQGISLDNFNTVSSIEACSNTTVDLTKAIEGNDPDLRYTYFTDPAATTFVRVPRAVAEEGTYYVKATNNSGCYKIKPVMVILRSVNLMITDPPSNCAPGTIDITPPSVTKNSEPGLIYTYWEDPNAISSLKEPHRIAISGTYYIKGTSKLGCYTIKPVTVIITDMIVHPQSACGSVNLTSNDVTQGSSAGFAFTYWKDSAATLSLQNPSEITASGTYFIKGINSACSRLIPVEVIVYPLPQLNIINPPAVTFPKTVDLTLAPQQSSDMELSYWKDANSTIPVSEPETIHTSGTYYIKATNSNACSVVIPVIVTVHEPPIVKVQTKNTFTPNHDGINDYFELKITGEVHLNSFRIYNRWGQLIFNARNLENLWDGTVNGTAQPTGTYYWMFDATDIFRKEQVKMNGSITLLR